MFSSHKNLVHIEDKIAFAISKLERWSRLMGFKFSTGKCKAVHFCRKRNCQPNPVTVNGSIVPYVQSTRFLGMETDSKLTWNAHVSKLKNSCASKLNAIRCLGGVHKGASRDTLLKVVQSMIVSKIEYGAQFYDSSCNSTLKTLEPILNEGLRIATGAFRTSSIAAILGDTGLDSLQQRRKYIVMKAAVKMLSNPERIVSRFSILDINHLLHRANTLFAEFGIPKEIWKDRRFRQGPSWKDVGRFVDISLSKLKKETTTNHVYLSRFAEFKENHATYDFFYTDGSRLDEKVGFGLVRNDAILMRQKAPDHWSIFSAEATAILQALNWVQGSDTMDNVIVSDSLSVLTAIKNLSPTNVIVRDIRDVLQTSNKNIILYWAPSHMGIKGNELADEAARSATLLTHIPDKRSTSEDIAKLIKKQMHVQKCVEWSNGTKQLHTIKDKPIKWLSSSWQNRRDSVVICRLRIGHTRLTHGYIFERTAPPQCDVCHVNLTVEHVLILCRKFRAQRQRFSIPDTLKEALGDDPHQLQNVLGFLKEVDLYNEI